MYKANSVLFCNVKKHMRNSNFDNDNQNESLSLVKSITKNKNNLLQKIYTLLDKNGHDIMKSWGCPFFCYLLSVAFKK